MAVHHIAYVDIWLFEPGGRTRSSAILISGQSPGLVMRGTYCLVISLDKATASEIGSLGNVSFPPGIYVYVGSALGGIEKRVGRHKSVSKKRRWHIDWLLEFADIVASIALPCDTKAVECEAARALMQCDGAEVNVRGFGSSDCECVSHLIFFGDSDPEWAAEAITRRLAMLECMYPRKAGGKGTQES